MLLRQPLYRALAEAGHELMLVVRPLLTPLASLIAPEARVFACDANLYNPRLTPDAPDLDLVAEAAREFDPDILLVAPFQWTVLEERLAQEVGLGAGSLTSSPAHLLTSIPIEPGTARLPKRAKVIAMSGRRFADPEFGPAPETTLVPTVVVDVAEDTPEVRKNELLVGAILGRAVTLPAPAIVAPPASLRAAEAHLARFGLEPGGYWAACVGDTQWTRIRNWPAQKWATCLTEWSKQGHRFLMVGTTEEAAAAQDVMEAMEDSGGPGGAVGIWSGEGEGDLDTLLGLIAHSAGYVGRDTGPMHLAAALGKPVLAVFGGGTWPRFLPASEKSISLAVGVPCVGCGWNCEVGDSYCIKEVPVGEVLGAFEELQEVSRCQGVKVSSGKAGRALDTSTPRHLDTSSPPVRFLDPGAPLLARIGREAAHKSRERRVSLSVVRREHMEQNEALTAVLERSVKRAGEADRLAHEVDALRAEMTRREAILRTRLAAEQNLMRAREADLNRRIQELEASEFAAKSQASLVGHYQGENAHLRDELILARAAAEDAQLKEARVRGDLATMTELCRQHEVDNWTMRERLRELMASRWRKYGQRMRLCMTMPWEAEMANGKH